MGIKSFFGGVWSGLANGDNDKDKPPVEKPAPIIKPKKPFGGLPSGGPTLPDTADAPPPKPMTALDHANSLPSTRPTRPAPVDTTKELGDAPIKGLKDIPDVPTRTPLDKSQTTGFKNRLKGAWEGIQNAGLHGGNGLQVIGAAIGGAANRERSNKGVWEQTVELPEIQKRNARTKEIVAAQKGYDEAAKGIETRNDKSEKRYQDDTKNYQWAEELKNKALEADATRKAKAAENEATRAGKVSDAELKHKQAMEMRDRWEKHNAEQKDLDRKARLTEQQMREKEEMRREEFRAKNNLERDFYKYTADATDTASSEPTPAEVDEALKSSPAGTTREQVASDLRNSKSKKAKGKPGAANAASKIGERLGWNNIPSGK